MPAVLTTEDEFVGRICQAARRGGASELDVATLRQLVLYRHEFETLQQAARVRALEASLSEMHAGERRDAICERMDLSRRRYYELRKLASAAPDRTAEL
jgi:hypothetical protein